MNPKQRKFVAEYLKDQNATQAAIRAGYSKKTARFQACDLLTKPNIKAAVEAKLKKAEEDAGVSAAWILSKLKEVVERCTQGTPVMEFNHETKQMEPTGEWEFDSAGANRALELLGKNKCLFIDNVKHSGVISYDKFIEGSNDAKPS